jgi:hypothetical protein
MCLQGPGTGIGPPGGSTFAADLGSAAVFAPASEVASHGAGLGLGGKTTVRQRPFVVGLMPLHPTMCQHIGDYAATGQRAVKFQMLWLCCPRSCRKSLSKTRRGTTRANHFLASPLLTPAL